MSYAFTAFRASIDYQSFKLELSLNSNVPTWFGLANACAPGQKTSPVMEKWDRVERTAIPKRRRLIACARRVFDLNNPTVVTEYDWMIKR